MPNHVTTICTITGLSADVDAFAERHVLQRKNDDGEPYSDFDFDTIIPKPSCVSETVSGPRAEVGLYALTGDNGPNRTEWLDHVFPDRRSDNPSVRWPFLPKDIDTRAKLLEHLKANDPEALDQGAKSKRCLDETGYPNWYEWSIANWGMKWGAYSTEERERGDGRYVFKFETAWSFPETIFRKLAELHPTLTIDVISYDEGSCFGCVGEFNGKNDFRCEKGLATDELFERVYGHKPDRDEEDEEVCP